MAKSNLLKRWKRYNISIKQIPYTSIKTSSKIVYYIIKNNTEEHRQQRTKQNSKCLKTRWAVFPAKFKTTANEVGQRKTQLRN